MSNQFQAAQRAYIARRTNEAIGLLNQTIALNPRHAEAHHLLGVIEAQETRFESALRHLDSAIALDPKKLTYLVDRANIVASLGRPNEAIEAYNKALQLNPKLVEAWSNKGQALRLLGKVSDAIKCYKEAVRLDPTFLDAYRALGQTSWIVNDFESAISAYSAVLARYPHDLRALMERGICRANIRQFDGALDDFLAITSLVPDHAEAHARAASALNELERFKPALEHANRAIILDPKNPEWVGFRCKALIGLDRPADALREVELMVKLGAREDLYLMWEGFCYIEMHQFEKAEVIYDRMIRTTPQSALWYFNRGVALAKQRRYVEAVSAYSEAVARDPDHATAHWNKSLCTLVQSDPQGWELYEWRWKLPTIGPSLDRQPKGIRRWNGHEDISGKKVLLSAEQGLGDSIMFCRFAALLKSMGAAHVTVGVPTPLRRLLGSIENVDAVVDNFEQKDLSFDFFCPMMSLPKCLQMDFNHIPYGETAYLHSDATLVDKWRGILDLATNYSGKPRVGLMWSGRKVISLGGRSVNLTMLLPLINEQFDFISLQKELPEEDAETIRAHGIHHFGDEQEDFADAAAIIDLVDLVITIDTSIAHLAGALGKETWILLQFDAEWRWLLNRDNSPWYPKARLFRQPKPGDWLSVIDSVKGEMISRLS
jgi:tetratricopeptide (TPR) repeat protein